MEQEIEFQSIQELLEAGEAKQAFAALKQLHAQMGESAVNAWRIHELFGACFASFGDAEGAAQAYFRAAQADRYLRAQRGHYSNYLFALHYLAGIPKDALRKVHFHYNNLYKEPEEALCLPAEGKLRVGYLAPTFGDHAAAYFFAPFLRDFSQDKMEVFAYAFGERPNFLGVADEVVRRLFYGISEVEAAEVIRADRLDVIVDLAGHSAGGESLMILARKVAPVQISGIGYFDTTGLPAVDYLMADEEVLPAEEEGECVERPLRLPHLFAFAPTDEMRAMREEKIAQTGGKLGAFVNFMKLNDVVLRLWLEILREHPKARLILQDTIPFEDRLQGLSARMEAMGYPMERVSIHMGSIDYLDKIRTVDVLLDPFPYTGGAMTAIALYLGVPVVTLRGERYGARFGASILTAANLSELIADSPEHYRQIVGALFRGECKACAEKLNALEQSALMDCAGYARDFEAKLRALAGK